MSRNNDQKSASVQKSAKIIFKSALNRHKNWIGQKRPTKVKNPNKLTKTQILQILPQKSKTGNTEAGQISPAHEMSEDQYYCERIALLLLFRSRGRPGFALLINSILNTVQQGVKRCRESVLISVSASVSTKRRASISRGAADVCGVKFPQLPLDPPLITIMRFIHENY